MGTIHNLASRFAALNWHAIKEISLIETAPSVIPEMTEQQMRLGERSDGAEIGSDNQGTHGFLQDNIYAEIKIESGGLAPYKVPDLRLNGSFQEGLRTVVTPELSLKTYSLDLKAPKLEKWYGQNIYGANKENLSKYAREDLQPVLLQKLKAATVG